MSSPPAADGPPSEAELDLDTRQLCPDGNCVGVVDERGVCKVCGASAGAEPVAPDSVAPDTAGGDRSSVGDDEDIETRQLCPDGACIGVIGPDGRCKVCGRPAAAAATPA